ncbi:hypothetical protein A9K55_001129 [Cordyceps militaris]|uniref:LITAF domain-containing protein n=1 Tax=Cordyceps militaris TaxID=73501 RepID=A0A2H4SUZ8_CORMI|nr:hypothetical protein A9K55_001129 [Cordyceps militaris]
MGKQPVTPGPPPPRTTPTQEDLLKHRQELVNLTYKRGEFVTCPACRHGSTSVLASERLAGWRYAACTAVAIVFAPLTFGVMLFVLPLLFKPQFAVHSCRRCGLRLAITTGGLGDYAFTIAANVADENFAPAEDDWRPDLARLPGGMRVARSPLGPRPDIAEKDMKTCSKRFARCKARTRIKLASEDWLQGTVRCMVMTGPKNPATALERAQGEGEVFCQIHLSNPTEPASVTNPNPRIQVMMRTSTALSPQNAPHEDQPPPPHTTSADESLPPPYEFTETCLIRLFPGDNYSVHFHLPASTNPPAYSSSSSASASARPTVNTSPVTKRFRTQFWGGMPIWRWKSSEGNLMWVSRRFRDADMTSLDTTLCLVDDYERLVAAVDGWQSWRMPGVASGADGSGGMVRECRMKLYADLDTGVLGEILGSYCALLAQVRRATKVLKREEDDKRSTY